MKARNAPTTVLDDDLLRLRLMLLVFLLGIALLGAFLWRIQVANTGQYEVDLAKQSIRRVRLPGVRGCLYDRQGNVLAENRPAHGVALYLEELRQPGPLKRTVDHVESVVSNLSAIVQLSPEIDREAIRTHIRRRLPLPLVVWRELPEAALARLVESGLSVPGVDIYTQPVRVYPLGALACHAIGYVGRAEPAKVENEEESYHYYLPEMAGRAGVEKSMDDLLRGEAGGRLLRVDVSGYRRNDIGMRTPRRGHDLMLSLDAKIQQTAESILSDTAGSIVVIDPNNGDVIALASSPGYDLNQFIPGISSENWKTLNDDPNTPLLHRAIAGTYPPGSTFKMITALAGLVNGKARPEDVHHCPGYFRLGNVTFRCWLRSGHGPVNLEQAIEGSCNVYCFHVGLDSGIDAIANMARAFGMGDRTGIALDGEARGLVPDAAWKRRVYEDGWRDGDTCNVSIGQGALLATPLQMAVMTAALANGGIVYQPRLILGVRPEAGETFRTLDPVVVNRMLWDRKHLNIVRLGMKDVVMSPTGTGRTARIPGVVMAGKTGTAEFGRKDEKRRHAWMVAFAPFDAPRYAVAMLIDEGVSGGETAAPRMKLLMQALFPESQPAAVGGGAG
ncbi:MAG TPA: penicillin-binding protein 2 [Kiritimatiellia bacterium]|nr:penicillin-binding protein 2 [Kiritimatiellia bacterium]HMP34560.1 penicillin-binding protein 2 [Kiritimatiellia bacterium]